MRKGQGLYNLHPVYFVPGQDQLQTLPPEVFVDVTDLMVPGVQPYYMISNYGRLWHKYKQRIIKPDIDSHKYLYKSLASVNGTGIPVRIHRLVMLAFAYRPDHANFVVNHIDTNPLNCTITNLEWTTFEENVQYSARLGDVGTKYTDEQVMQVCEMLQAGELLTDIADKTGVSLQVVNAIQARRTHTNISQNYSFERRKTERNLSDAEIKNVCLFLQEHKEDMKMLNVNDKCRAVMINLNLDTSNNMLKTLQKIITRTTYSYISKDYDF